MPDILYFRLVDTRLVDNRVVDTRLVNTKVIDTRIVDTRMSTCFFSIILIFIYPPTPTTTINLINLFISR